MAIFISYSHQDSDFVDTLAANLVRARHHVWMDRWELNVGDSITSKIEENLTDSDAILLILSKSSVASTWCRRELNAGLIRELEEKRTVVLPVVIDNCEIPLFLRDKLYADFRDNPDKGFDLIDRSLSRISNPTMSRFESPEFHTDFSMDWQLSDNPRNEESWNIRLTFVDHSEKFPYVVVSEFKVYDLGGRGFMDREVRSDRTVELAFQILEKATKQEEKEPLSVQINDNLPNYAAWRIEIDSGQPLQIVFSYRRLGADNGMDTVVHLGNNLKLALHHVERILNDQRENRS